MMIWHVYIATARREFDVAAGLRRLGADAFVPHVVVQRVKAGRRTLETQALVAKYVFAGFSVVPWTDLLDIKHLSGVVSIADEPARMTRRDLAKARSMSEPPIAKVAPLKVGQRVKITSGALAECAAIIEEMMEGTVVLDIAKAGRVTISKRDLVAA